MILCKKEPRRSFFLSTALYGAGSAAAVALGYAGPALTGHAHGPTTWMLPIVVSSCVVGGLRHAACVRGGQGCFQTLQDAASRVLHARPQAVKARWLQVFN